MTRKTESKTDRFNFRLTPDLKRRAEAAAAADHRSLASLMEKLLGDYVREFERESEKVSRRMGAQARGDLASALGPLLKPRERRR